MARSEDLERTRGLVASDREISTLQLSDEISRAMWPIATIIADGNRMLATIATKLGAPTTAAT